MSTTTRTDPDLASTLALKLLSVELAFADTCGPKRTVRQDLAAERADAVAETVIAVFDLPLTPFGLREAVRTFIRAAGPQPSQTSPDARKVWFGTVRGEIAVTLAGG